jgi:hypothetical protein
VAPTHPALKPAFAMTGEQVAIVDAARGGNRVVGEALAGTGKTSTAVEITKAMPGVPTTYIAFNKSVQREAEGRFPVEWVDCRTGHSLAYHAAAKPYANRLPGNPGASRITAQAMARAMKVKPALLDSATLNPVVVTRMAQATVNAYMKTADPTVAAHHIPQRVLGLHDPVALADAILPVAEKIWEDLTNPKGRFRFTPDVYLKLAQLQDMRIPSDLLIFDEAQDADPVMAAIVRRQEAFGSQIVWIGDPNQAIYGWRGAVDAMSQIEDAVRLSLTMSFRFGLVIAAFANGWLERLGSKQRVVGYDKIQSRVVTPDMLPEPRAILCRGNGTALGWVLRFQEREVPVALAPGDKSAGKDIERFAWAARDLMQANGTDHPDLVGFTDWDQLCKYVDEEEDTDDLKRMVGIINRIGVSKVIDAVRGLAAEKDAKVTVSTAHKAKGLEWDSVRVADDFVPPADKETGDLLPPAPEDFMLNYVTVTRAKLMLDPGPLDPTLWR